MSILNTAYSGLNAFQTAMSVIGNNITNATTKGYTRQTIQLIPSLTQKIGNASVGSGVSIAAVLRNSDDFADYQVRNTSSLKSQYDTFFQQASQIDKLLAQDGVSLSSSMQNFFTAFSQMNSNPSDSAGRTVVLKQSQLLTSQFNYLQTRLDQYQENSTLQVKQTVDQINTITANLSVLNRQIVATPDAPELLDQRSTLLEQLAQFSDLNVVKQGNGTVNVAFGNGETLVAGTERRELQVGSGRSNTFGTKILLQGQDVTNSFTSGSLKGILDFEANVLGKASQMIGQMAIGISQAFNAQQALGLDMNDNIGTNFFSDFNSDIVQKSRAISASFNSGSAVLRVNISDISQTKISDYELTVADATNHKYNLIRKSDGTTIPLTWDSSSSSSPATLSVDGTGETTIDGMTISVDDIASFADSDQFTIAPTRGAASKFSMAISDFRSIALASPVRTSADPDNKGQASMTLGAVYNNSAVANNYTVTFDPNDPSQYTISGDPTVYTLTDNTIYLPPGSNESSASYSVKISGTPSGGDVFNMGYNNGAVGDNSNGLLLAQIQQKMLFSGGTENLIDRYSDLTSQVGADTNDAKLRAESADVIYSQAIDFQSSKSGVNLDEEAANLLKFQQAYQAAGKLMQVVNQLMNVVFDMVG